MSSWYTQSKDHKTRTFFQVIAIALNGKMPVHSDGMFWQTRNNIYLTTTTASKKSLAKLIMLITLLHNKEDLIMKHYTSNSLYICILCKKYPMFTKISIKHFTDCYQSFQINKSVPKTCYLSEDLLWKRDSGTRQWAGNREVIKCQSANTKRYWRKKMSFSFFYTLQF